MKIKDAPALFISGLLLFAIICQQSAASADILVLKNGRRIKADTVWKDGDLFKCDTLGSTVGYPEENVEKIIREHLPEPEQQVSVPAAQNTGRNIAGSVFPAAAPPQKTAAGVDLKPAKRTILLALFALFFLLMFKLILVATLKRLFRITAGRWKRIVPSVYGFLAGQRDEAERKYAYEKARGLFTGAEMDFLSVLKEVVGDEYLIQGKVRLADIISPENRPGRNHSLWAFRKISQKHVDFILCDKDDYTILGVIELDDKSHFRFDRIARDRFVNEALSSAGIPILHCPVKRKYSPSELQESINEALDLDLESATLSRSFGGRSAGAEKGDKPFVDKDGDLRWAPPGFKF